MVVYVCQSCSPSSSHAPLSHCPHVSSLPLCLYPCPENRFICTILTLKVQRWCLWIMLTGKLRLYYYLILVFSSNHYYLGKKHSLCAKQCLILLINKTITVLWDRYDYYHSQSFSDWKNTEIKRMNNCAKMCTSNSSCSLIPQPWYLLTLSIIVLFFFTVSVYVFILEYNWYMYIPSLLTLPPTLP